MNGITFVSRSQAQPAEFKTLQRALVAAPVYEGDNPLTHHLQTAMWHPATELSVREHINPATGRGFECLSYYSDDPYVLAYCAAHADSYLATIGIQFVRRLVKVCHRLAPALERRPRNPKRGTEDGPSLERDAVLAGLIDGDAEVSEAEALEIVSVWPPASTEGAQIGLGEFALFYDLIRLVWLHEWAHALCGHVAFASQRLGIAQLHEFSADRAGSGIVDTLKYPKSEMLQALEIHADEFAARYCVRQILWGYDPVGRMAGPTVDLVDRVLFFNVACCVFAVMWSQAEQRYAPGISYYPPLEPLTSDKPDPMFKSFPTSHPPATLRYLRFRHFQQDCAVAYIPQSHRMFPTMVDSCSWGVLNRLGEMDARFFSLFNETPLAATTPAMKRLYAYEDYLLKIGVSLAPFTTAVGYVPTADPAGDDEA